MIVRKFENIERIANYLMLNSYFINDMSLWYGQMGIALSFSDYYRYTGNQIYLDTASFLLNNISENINSCKTLSFSSGLLGIGWGIEYLLQNKIIEGNGVEICESIDQSIMEINLKRIPDLNLENGIMGLLHYVIYHLQGAIRIGTELPFDETYLSELNKLCIISKKQNTLNALNSLLDIYIKFYQSGLISNYNFPLINFVKVSFIEMQEKLSFYPIGLRTGLAGFMLNIINTNNNEEHLYI